MIELKNAAASGLPATMKYLSGVQVRLASHPSSRAGRRPLTLLIATDQNNGQPVTLVQ